MNTQPSLSKLLSQLSSRSGIKRQRAREALVKMGEKAVPALLALVDSPSKQLRWEVTKALGEIADSRAIPALIKRLTDREAGIRWLAAVGLIRIGPASLQPVLQALIAAPDSRPLRQGVHHILHDLVAQDPSLADILNPVLYTLSDFQPVDSVAPAALEAIARLEAVSKTLQES